MKRITRFIVILLTLCQIVGCAAACNKGDAAIGETGSDTQGAAGLTKEGLSEYVIVVPAGKKNVFKDAISLINSTVSSMIGSELEVREDIDSEAECEILVGNVNRAEALEYYEGVGEYDSGYTMIGKKVLVVGLSANLLRQSARLFNNYILENDTKGEVLMISGVENIYHDEPVLSEYEKWIENSKTKYYNPVLERLTINALGDSYFEGQGLPSEQVWLSLLDAKYNMNMNNYGKGGSTISNYVTSNNPMCQRYLSMANNKPDIILFEGGRNDFNKGVPIGSVDSTDTKTFSGALNVTIEGLKKKYPNAMIICISNWNFPGSSSGLNYASYANAMESVAKKQGVYFIKACDPNVSGIDMSSENFRKEYSMKTSDISHLNYAGMKIAMSNFEPIIAEYYQDFISKK